MIPAFAGFALVAAIYGGATKRPAWSASARRAAYACFALSSIAMACAIAVFTYDRFDIASVASSSSRDLWFGYKVCFWAGSTRGKYLLATWLVTAVSAFAIFRSRTSHRALIPGLTTALMTNVMFFSIASARYQNVFESLGARLLSDGAGMIPQLQSPVFVATRLLSEVGFATLLVPLCFAISSLLSRESTDWIRAARRWTTLACGLLGAAGLLDCWWTYETLAATPYFMWSFSQLQWLATLVFGLAALCTPRPAETAIATAWYRAMVGMAYLGALVAPWEARMGFAGSPLTLPLTLFFLLMATPFFPLIVFRAWLDRRRIGATQLDAGRVVAWLESLSLGALGIGLVAVISDSELFPGLVTGSSDPLFPNHLPILRQCATVFGALLLALAGLAAALRSGLTPRAQLLVSSFVAAMAAAAAFRSGVRSFDPLLFVVLGGFAASAVAGAWGSALADRLDVGQTARAAFLEAVRSTPRTFGRYLATLGFALVSVATSGSDLEAADTRTVRPGEQWTIGDHTLRYRSLSKVSDEQSSGARLRLSLRESGSPIATLLPERSFHYRSNQPVVYPAVVSSLTRDLVVVFKELRADQSVVVEVSIVPWIRGLWMGGALFVIGLGTCLIPTTRGSQP